MGWLPELWPLFLGLLAGGVLYLKGQLDGSRKAARKSEKAARKTHARINNAPITTTLSEARAWLLAHAQRLRGKRRP